MIAPPDYAFEEKAARLANAEKLRENLNTPDVQLKVRSWADRHSLEPEFVRYKVLTDDMFALHFIKDPAKQSLHQKVAANHIRKSVPLVEGFEALPSGGAKAEYVVNGMVVPGSVRTTISAEGKSIDFKWSYARDGRSFRVFATHKHTKEAGGSQDNQFSDVRQFLEAAQASLDPNMLFLAICDGDYYQQPCEGCPSRLALLQRDYGRRRVRACTIATLPALLAEEVRCWIEGQQKTPTAAEEIAFLSMRV